MKKQKILLIARVSGLILSIFVGYLLLAGGRCSQLVGYFLYMSIACSIIPLPTPPYVMAIGRNFHPWIAGLVGALGNCIAGFVEYRFIAWLFTKTKLQQKIETNKYFKQFARCYKRATFLCLIVTGFTPIPFEPFRLAAILYRYNMPKYLLAIVVGRFPRYYLMGMLGHTIQIPDKYLVVIFIFLFLAPVINSIIEKSIQSEHCKLK